MADWDLISSRISPGCPVETQQVLTAAWSHKVDIVKKLLDVPGMASLRDPKTGETPLHAAIRACGPASEEDTPEDVQAARDIVYELLLWGGIWNDVDDHNETPGCVAARLGREQLYNLCVDAGVRAEMLFGVLSEYEELASGEDEDKDGDETNNGNDALDDGDEAPVLLTVEREHAREEATENSSELGIQPPKPHDKTDNASEDYLQSTLTFSNVKLVDSNGNGVMMAWETEIMRQSVDALLPNRQPSKRILNIGFGLGIIDTIFAETRPGKHHIVEAHPEVLAHVSAPKSRFGALWEADSPEAGAFKVYEGRWQDICPKLLEEGQTYDAIYFDTFGEDYSQLRMFFTDYIPGLLDQHGRFGFFNGLGADRKICYDVYTRVSELHLLDAGLNVEWKVVDVNMEGLAEAGKGAWDGVERRYWTLDSQYSRTCPSMSSADQNTEYRLPVCTFMG